MLNWQEDGFAEEQTRNLELSHSDSVYELEDQTNLGTTWSRVLFDGLTGPQPVKKLPAF